MKCLVACASCTNGFVKEWALIWCIVLHSGTLRPVLNFNSTNPNPFPDKRQRYSDKDMKHIFFFILTTLAFLSCNSQKEAPIHNLFFYVRYDQAEGSIHAEAKFQDEKNKTSDEMPGGFWYQGVEMPLTPVYGMTYRYEYAAEFLPEHKFEWRDKQNNTQTFKMGIEPIKSFQLNNKTVNKSEPTELTWDGAPLSKGESMVFMWENSQKGLTVPMEVTTTSASPRIIVPAAKFKDFVAGDWTLYLVRKKLLKDVVDHYPVNGIMEFYTKPIKIQVDK